ncbi:MAG: hypothetical protein IT383_19215 [Deltaproteobacteria bacterium]|nr:hypothetical protein [Deltaproteobacteria bacterium]
MHHRTLSAALLFITATACAVDVSDGVALDGTPARARVGAAPLEGSAQGADVAENACGIVLREVRRPSNGMGGYESSCGDSGCQYVWAGTVDVSEEQLALGATPHVLYQTSMGERAWWEVDAVDVGTAGAGNRRFAFRIDEHTPSPGMSFSSLNRTRIELVPFLRDAAGNRWFDHNRNANPFENYVLVVDNAWSVSDDPSVCPSPAQPDWMGNVVARISRDSSHACNGGTPLGDELRYDGWARQRAAVRNVCFEVWEPGVTDWDNPDQWRQLDVRAHYRFASDAAWQWQWLGALDHAGNNARFALGLGGLDPFAPYTCTSVPTEIVAQPDGDRARASMQLYFTVNGAELRPSAGAAWLVRFEEYVSALPAGPCP